MKSNPRNRQSGMTLAEVLVAVAIFALIFVAALMIYDRSNRVFSTGMEAADVQQNTRIAFDKMLADLRMAGFDFDRDGIPTAAGEMQQIDEQIEYAGPRAVTVRANLDYNEAGTNRGREAALEAPNSQFPIVTTGNDEIVTYALVSETGANADEIVFYADVTDGTDAARESFAAAGGEIEDEITIDGVDLCTSGTCDEPPYTLMRITLDAKGEPVRTPLASNIRSMEFDYFSDSAGVTALAIADAGGGQWNPANPAASEAERTVRSRVRAIGVTVIGMTDAPDPGYTDPDETIASAAAFRKYRLETLVAPRNMGKRGLREQQTAAPGPPTLDNVCFGYCEGVRISWTAPAANPAFGSVESYVVLWDTDVTAPDTEPPLFAIPVGLANYYDLFHASLDANTEYRFSIAASNSWGTTYSNQVIRGKPLNRTTQKSPTDLTATDETAPLENQIDLAWVMPTENVAGEDQGSCEDLAGSTMAVTLLPQYSETRGVEVWRSLGDANFDPLASPLPATTLKVIETSGPATSYSDTTAANCQDYYYRVRIAEPCCEDPATQNVAPGEPWSDFFPPVGDPAIKGRAESDDAPSAPAALTVLDTSACAGNSCNVELEWPEVTTNVNGDPIAVASYVLEIEQKLQGALTAPTPYGGSPYTVNHSTGLTTTAGLAHYTALNLPGNHPILGNRFEYTFRVSAEQCTLTSDPSPDAIFPKCDFAAGGDVVISMDSLGGDGSAGAPFEVEAGGTITFGTTTGETLQTASATAVEASSSAPFADLGTSPDPAGATLTLAWPAGSTDTVYRVDYSITDDTGCETSGSFYVRDVEVSCPFVVPVVPSANLASRTVTLTLNNNSNFVIDVRSLRFNWDEDIARTPTNRDATISSVQFPNTSGGTVNAGLSGVIDGSGGGGTAVATIDASDKDLPAQDQTGTYQIRINWIIEQGPGGQALDGDPISDAGDFAEDVTVFYRLPTDTTDRECRVFPLVP